MRYLVAVVTVLLALVVGWAHAQDQAQTQQVNAGEAGGEAEGAKKKPEAKSKPQPVQQGLVGSPLKLRLTYHIYLFFLGLPIGTLALSAVLFFGYIGLSKSPVDIPLQLS
eukprot:TRINITY_DN13187_c0_g1_i1.p3 TRINITY_DN13187_c0_g1~~TRINITY_DN13187_c0_g1_i1.p3  ORF type:complete len:110 (+),score=30.77 TRINITY_DN13187_c0_g1_i1:201-530(+)